MGRRMGDLIAVVALVRPIQAAQAAQVAEADPDPGLDTAPRQSLVRIGMTYAVQILEEHMRAHSAERERLAETVLRSLSIRFAVVDRQGTIGYLTETSARALEDDCDLDAGGGRLIARGQTNQQALQGAVEAAAAEGRTSVLQLEGAEGPARTLVVVPIPGPGGMRAGSPDERPSKGRGGAPAGSRPGRALVVLGQERGDTGLRDLLLEAYGLTLAEQRLARRLLAGMSLNDAAAATNLSISTARSYLKRIFTKTGINRQSQLIALYHTLIPPVRSTGPGPTPRPVPRPERQVERQAERRSERRPEPQPDGAGTDDARPTARA